MVGIIGLDFLYECEYNKIEKPMFATMTVDNMYNRWTIESLFFTVKITWCDSDKNQLVNNLTHYRTLIMLDGLADIFF